MIDQGHECTHTPGADDKLATKTYFTSSASARAQSSSCLAVFARFTVPGKMSLAWSSGSVTKVTLSLHARACLVGFSSFARSPWKKSDKQQ